MAPVAPVVAASANAPACSDRRSRRRADHAARDETHGTGDEQARCGAESAVKSSLRGAGRQGAADGDEGHDEGNAFHDHSSVDSRDGARRRRGVRRRAGRIYGAKDREGPPRGEGVELDALARIGSDFFASDPGFARPANDAKAHWPPGHRAPEPVGYADGQAPIEPGENAGYKIPLSACVAQ